MQPGFVIMQIGNPELDVVYERAVAPALSACGFEPRRVDRHNRGGLLVSEIIAFIDEAEVLVADLTHERPNCYLELGYAIGISKLTELILTARADHDPHQPGLKAFTSAVLGGIGNIPGAMVGGIFLGLVESIGPSLFLEGLGIKAAYQLKDAIAFIMLVLVLIFRPTGILGERLAVKKA